MFEVKCMMGVGSKWFSVNFKCGSPSIFTSSDFTNIDFRSAALSSLSPFLRLTGAAC